MIYVPNFDNNTCCYMYDSNTLRCYKTAPVVNTTIQYTDYFVNSHYLYRNGESNFGNYGYNLNITCLDNSSYTDSFYYRNDITSILLCFAIFVGIIYFIFSKVLKAFFKGVL